MNKVKELIATMSEEELSEACKTVLEEQKKRRQMKVIKYKHEVSKLFSRIINEGYDIDIHYDNVDGYNINIIDREEY